MAEHFPADTLVRLCENMLASIVEAPKGCPDTQIRLPFGTQGVIDHTFDAKNPEFQVLCVDLGSEGTYKVAVMPEALGVE